VNEIFTTTLKQTYFIYFYIAHHVVVVWSGGNFCPTVTTPESSLSACALRHANFTADGILK